MNGENLTIIAAALANTISTNMTAAQLDLWAALFSMIGDALGVIAQTRPSDNNNDNFIV
ncbi:MAG: hypothetical protein UIL37_01655 [Clostridia bacterium]|nr:hypothetical protein [Clostridia bacterium]